jgi:hypothetical protein
LSKCYLSSRLKIDTYPAVPVGALPKVTMITNCRPRTEQAFLGPLGGASALFFNDDLGDAFQVKHSQLGDVNDEARDCRRQHRSDKGGVEETHSGEEMAKKRRSKRST